MYNLLCLSRQSQGFFVESCVFCHRMLRLAETGLMIHWRSKGFRHRSECTGLERKGQTSQITLAHVYGAFYLLGILSFIAFIVLICEISISKKHNLMCKTATKKKMDTFSKPIETKKLFNNDIYATSYKVEFCNMFNTIESKATLPEEINHRLSRRSTENVPINKGKENTVFKRQMSADNTLDNFPMVAAVASRILTLKRKSTKTSASQLDDIITNGHI